MKKIETGKWINAAASSRPARAFLFFLSLFTTCHLLPACAYAEVPLKFTYQGNLRQSGFLANGNRSMVFRIYGSSFSAAGAELWTSPAYSVSLSTGVFRVTLEPALLDWQSGSLWLELEVEGNRMSPREEITSSPYAINSALHSGKKYTTSDTEPVSPDTGDLWMNTTLKALYFWNGSAWIATASSGVLHAVTHAGGGLDAITSLGAHNITGDVTFYGGVGLRSSGQGVLVSTNLIVTGALNPFSNLYAGGAGYSVSFASSVSAGIFNGSGLYLSGAAGYDGNMLVISTGPSTVIRMTGAGEIYANKFYGDGSGMSGIIAVGDNLGNHIATATLNLAGFPISNAGAVTGSSFTATGTGLGAAQLRLADNVIVSSEASAALGGGVRISTNVYIEGFSSAARYYGDGSGLTNIAVAGDNLGNHIATTTLQMGAYGINTSSDITAGRYQIAGNTALAVLPGSYSLGVGVAAGMVNMGNNNSFLGYAAGYSNTFGNNNSFLGYAAGYSNISGGYNSFVGYQAGYSNISGENNSFVGDNAGHSNVTGMNNTIFGYNAGYGISGNSYSGNTLVGYRSGFGLTGSENIFLGWQAGFAVTTGAGNIVIGYNKDTSAPAANNELNIGGVLYGNLSAKTIGISTRAPQAALDIVSTGTTAGQMAQIWRSGSGVIVGSMSATGVFKAVKLLGDGSGLTGLTGVADNLGNHIATINLNMAGNSIVNAASGAFSQGVTASSFTATGTGVSAAQLRLADNVIISSEAGAASGGGVRISSNVYIVGFSSAAKYYGDGSGLTNIAVTGDNLGDHVATRNLNMSGFDIAGVSTLVVSSVATTAAGVTFSTNVFITGNVGIGLGEPAARLEVKGVAAQKYSLAVGTGMAHQVVVSTSGAVGIGTETPRAKMEVSGGEGSGEYIVIFNSGSKITAWLRNK